MATISEDKIIEVSASEVIAGVTYEFIEGTLQKRVTDLTQRSEDTITIAEYDLRNLSDMQDPIDALKRELNRQYKFLYFDTRNRKYVFGAIE